jgi:RNA polymerase sigma-70 factor (ECF subfamily)
MPAEAAQTVETLYQSDWGRILATLIGMLRDFDLAEDVAQEAFAAAVDQWRISGTPEFPRAWIIQTARHKAIDRIRRRSLTEQKLEEYVHSGFAPAAEQPAVETLGEIPDERLRLIFTCCHPALAMESQVALTLRTLCGLETDEIARAFLTPTPTMAQRLVRAKKKIRDAGIPYSVPSAAQMHERVNAVLAVIYLVFNEGYASTREDRLVRRHLCAEAVRLCRLVRELMGPHPPAEATALLAMMLLQDARREARLDEDGDIVLLEDQDRSLWDLAQIAEALPLVEEGLRRGGGPFALQAAIAALHCEAPRAVDTDWPQILGLYDLLQRVDASPVVALNRAVALAMVSGPRAGLDVINNIAAVGELENYHLLHAARAELLRRVGESEEAARSYERALELVTNAAERRHLERRLRELQTTV